jgi:hypothetical protein
MRSVSLVCASVIVVQAQAGLPPQVSTVPDEATTLKGPEEIGKRDNLTKFFFIATALCAISDTRRNREVFQDKEYSNPWDVMCGLKSILNVMI